MKGQNNEKATMFQALILSITGYSTRHGSKFHPLQPCPDELETETPIFKIR